MAAALLGVLVLPGVAAAQGEAMPVYNWVKASAPPANAVTAPEPPHAATCRAQNRGGGLWVGSWDGSHCMIFDGGSKVSSNRELQFLVVAPGSSPARWVPGRRSLAGALNAGDLFGGITTQYVCSQQGGVGALYEGTCSTVLATNGQAPVFVLLGVDRPVGAPGAASGGPAAGAATAGTAGGPAPNNGTGVPQYRWVAAGAPPANVVVAPDEPHYAVCRGRHGGSAPGTRVGLWTGRQCFGSYGGAPQPLEGPIAFLVLAGGGGARWAEGSNKRQPGNAGRFPPNVVNIGKNEFGLDQVVCSLAGGIGWVYDDVCEVTYFDMGGPNPYSMFKPTRLLIGTIQ
ncbi:hypothetical protein SAMN02745126_01618 [Enhydrobacter aerosaccus]|uniref:Uncharacterized protein n=2 Tax=Enhydrobacter aerosaccus TaxID=225324 RepID=A0A1T4LN77_9HYPH|nr:hypothetical protein SAMN02745126_01618 [Enhydrobacter aerosaccus]